MIPLDDIKQLVSREIGEFPERVTFVRGGMNFVFEIVLSTGSMMLKVYPAGREYIAEKESWLLQMAGAADIAVPKYVTDGYQGDHRYMLYHKVVGLELQFDNFNAENKSNFIQALATHLHRFSKLKASFFGSVTEAEIQYTSWRNFLNFNITTGIPNLEKANILRPKELDVIQRFMRAEMPNQRTGMAWGDIKSENIIVSNNRFASMIDFEACFYGDPVLSLGYLFSTEGNSNFFDSLSEEFQEVYHFEKKEIYFYAILRLLRISPYLNLPLPTGFPRQPVWLYFKGIREAIHLITS